MTAVWYNEIEPSAVAWLRSLMRHDMIPFGYIDTRPIQEIKPADLEGFTQCHFFAGIGTWAYAAREAEWPDDRPIWTASCPCQPFSNAGRRAGFNDPRDLWPHLFSLIRVCRPADVMGEQVGGSAGYDWLDRVYADLEAECYAPRARDIPACAVNSPQQRNRIYWVAGRTGLLVDGESERRGEGRPSPAIQRRWSAPAGPDAPSVMGDPDSEGLPLGEGEPRDPREELAAPVGTNDSTVWRFYEEHDWTLCHDEKWRRTKSRASDMVDGFTTWLHLGGYSGVIQADEEVDTYAESESCSTAEILRAVRRGTIAETEITRARGQESDDGLGRCEDVSSEALLFAFLSNVDGGDDGKRGVLSVAKNARRALRSVRRGCEPRTSSRERRSFGRDGSEHTDALRTLSQVLARHVATAWTAFRQADAPNMGLLVPSFRGRIPMWHGLGNAIHAGLAEEVIRAWLETEGDRPRSAPCGTGDLVSLVARNGAARRVLNDILAHHA